MHRALTATLTTVLMTGVLLALALGNEHLLSATEVAAGVNWIYLPAGLRMCYALVLPVQGTLAIFTATLLLAARDPSLTGLLVVENAAITAAGPILARTVAIQHLGLKPDLSNLNTRMLLMLAALFGFFGTALHQSFFASIGRESAFVSMWIGDTLGCLLFLYALKGITLLWGRWTVR